MSLSMKEKIEQLKKEKNAVILAHYYVADEIQEIADYVGDSFNLSKIAKKLEEDIIVLCGVFFMGKSACQEFIIGTEIGVLYELKKRNPDKLFYTLNDNQICHDMKYITLEKVYDVLLHETNQVEMDEEKRMAALKPLDRMLELAK